MSKAGRKRKEGHREPNGRLRRPTMAILNELNAKQIAENTSVVRMQPHRRGSDDPWLHSALGRFCRQAKCSEETYEGVVSYAVMKVRWSAAKGKPQGVERVSTLGSGAGPNDEQVRRWEAKLAEVHRSIIGHADLGHHGTFAMTQVHRLAVENLELRDDSLSQNTPLIRAAMGEIAAIMGTAERNPHPFKKSA